MAGQLTSRALGRSLKPLLLEKPLSKIVISEDCGISRMTFYRHFQDIRDLVWWACEKHAGALAGYRPTGMQGNAIASSLRNSSHAPSSAS